MSARTGFNSLRLYPTDCDIDEEHDVDRIAEVFNLGNISIVHLVVDIKGELRIFDVLVNLDRCTAASLAMMIRQN